MKEPYTQEQIDDALGLILVSIDPMWRPMVKSQAADAIKNLNITEDETV
jgi:ribosome maturation protein Sdo1